MAAIMRRRCFESDKRSNPGTSTANCAVMSRMGNGPFLINKLASLVGVISAATLIASGDDVESLVTCLAGLLDLPLAVLALPLALLPTLLLSLVLTSGLSLLFRSATPDSVFMVGNRQKQAGDSGESE